MNAEDVRLGAEANDKANFAHVFNPALEGTMAEHLRRAGVEHRMRVHAHGKRCVSVHLDAESATALVGMLARLRKLEKQAATAR